MIALATGITLVTGFAILLARGPMHGVCCGVCVGVFSLCFCALSWGSIAGHARRVAAGILVLSLVVGVAMLQPDDRPRAQGSGDIPRPPLPAETVDEDAAVTLGIGVHDLAHTSAGLVAVTASGVVAFDPRDKTAGPTEPIDGDVSAIAADGSHIVAVYGGNRGGFASAYDSRSFRRIGYELHYSEAPGAVAVGGGDAWLCNVTHSKLDRLDLSTGAFDEYPVQGRPNDVLLAVGAVWVTIASGWLERIDLVTKRIDVYRTAADPEEMVYAFGEIWISHPRIGLLTRMDPERRVPFGASIHVRVGTHAMAAFRGDLFAVSHDTDVLQRIDPTPGKVVSTIRLPARPSGITTFDGHLYVTSEAKGSIVPVIVRSRP